MCSCRRSVSVGTSRSLCCHDADILNCTQILYRLERYRKHTARMNNVKIITVNYDLYYFERGGRLSSDYRVSSLASPHVPPRFVFVP